MFKHLNKKIRKFQLALLCSLSVLIVLVLTNFFMLAGLFLFHQLGYQISKFYFRAPFWMFLFVSVCIGSLIAFVFSKRPLRPIREIGRATDEISKGHYETRIEIKGPYELSRLASQFNHMAEELQSVEMLRSDFVNNFSHEFKTPIVSIRGFAKMLRDYDLSEEERKEYLNIIITESDRLADLSSKVLNLSKLEQQTILTDTVSFDVSEQIRLAIAVLDQKWEEKQMEYDFESQDYTITGNEALLEQVWINLLDNAMKFSPKGSLISISIEQDAKKTTIQICNECEEISQEALRHIFDKFYQADTSHQAKGNGLGLAIVKRIVELHQGSIEACYTENGRLMFTIQLPLQIETEINEE